MTTDFSYGNKAIDSSGPIKPSGKNQPLDPRTEVKLYADIESIPCPYVGMIITVLEDETNQNKMTDYKVLSLKPNSLGIANSVIDQVQKYSAYLGVSTSSGTGGTGLTSEQEERLNKIPEIETSINNINESLNSKANTSDIPTNTSELYNDSGFLTSIPSEYVTETEMNEAIANVSSGGNVDLSGYATKDELNTKANTSDIPTNTSELYNDSGFLTSIPSEYVTETEMNEAIANVSILNQNGNTPLRIWAGTQQEYDALLTYDTNTVYLVEGGSIPTVTTYTITNNLTNVTNSNTSGRIEKNTSYTAMLSPSSGYEISTVTVTMGGIDITSTAYSNGHIEISSVTGNIIITATGVVSDNPTVTYTITNNLTNVSTSNSANSIVEGSSYEAKLSVSTGYSVGNVSITMGGVDITSTCYNNKTINISSVTGDIVIAAEAVESPGTTDIDSKYTLAYSLGEETVFDGSSNIETGVKLFDSDKDFTILADFTPLSQSATTMRQNVLFRIKQSKAPWIGTDISIWNESSTCGSRGSIISSTTKQGYILGKMCTGVPRDTTNRLKFVIKRVSADKKMYFYDSQGLIGSYSDPGNVASNSITTTIKLGGYFDSSTNYMNCTVHAFKVYFDAVDDSDITTLLE